MSRLDFIFLFIVVLFCSLGCTARGPLSTSFDNLDKTSKSWRPLPAPSTDLQNLVYTFVDQIPGEGSEAFIEPSEKEQREFSLLIRHLLDHDIPSAKALSPQLNYEITNLTDKMTKHEYFIAQEMTGTIKRASGIYIVNTKYQRNVVLSIPHPIFDYGTPSEGVRILEATQARALFIAGAFRCANSKKLPPEKQPETTRACKGAFRISDGAHNDKTFFQAAHSSLSSVIRPPIVISLHAKYDPEPVAIVGDGTFEIAKDQSSSSLITKGLRRRGINTQNCNEPHTKDDMPRLCGTTNVQGQLINLKSTPGIQMFIHIEQAEPLIYEPNKLIETLIDVAPRD